MKHSIQKLKAFRCKLTIDRAQKKPAGPGIDALVEVLQEFFKVDKYALVTSKTDFISKVWPEATEADKDKELVLAKDMKKIRLRTTIAKVSDISEMIHNLEYVPSLVSDCKYVYCYRTENEHNEVTTRLCYFFGFKENNLFRLLFKEYTKLIKAKTLLWENDRSSVDAG